jgi:hypothetical protein
MGGKKTFVRSLSLSLVISFFRVGSGGGVRQIARGDLSEGWQCIREPTS